MEGFMFQKASRLVAMVALLFSAMFAMAPTVAAHQADGGGVCNGSVKIVIFENWSQGGVSDDFCFYPYYNIAQDPDFDVNNTASTYVPDDDFGNRYLMDCCVSSWSVINGYTQPICVTFYTGTNFTGSWNHVQVAAGLHYHGDFIVYNDDFQSMKVKINPGYLQCSM